jgi:hypothetical protein
MIECSLTYQLPIKAPHMATSAAFTCLCPRSVLISFVSAIVLATNGNNNVEMRQSSGIVKSDVDNYKTFPL